MKKLNSIFILLWVAVVAFAAPFNREAYYSSADGKSGEALRKALTQILSSNGTVISYKNLWSAYTTTDVREDGTIWDMYSCTTNYDPSKDHDGNYHDEGDLFNREHSIPQSVFNEQSPMKSDLYHVYPTDGYVNNRRGSYCFGEVATVTYSSDENFSKLGTPTSTLTAAGCKETYVFEPNDEYKGDFARTYFYFVVRYASNMSNFKSYGMFTKSDLTSWASQMLLKWSKADVVSAKETNRIEAVYELQKNRNPFIDYPGLEEYIWGSYKNVPFSASNYVNPFTGQSQGGNDTPIEPTPTPTPTPEPIVADGDKYIKVTEEPNDWSGTYLIVYDETLVAFNGGLDALDSKSNYVNVTLEDGAIKVTEETEKAEVVVTKINDNSYSIMTSNGIYMGGRKGSNGIEEDDETPYVNSIIMGSNEVVDIVSDEMHFKFNPANKQERFRYFKSSSGGMKMVSLYRKTSTNSEPETPIIDEPGIVTVVEPVQNSTAQQEVIYDLSGRRLMSITRPGIYIVNGKKVVKL